MSSDMRGGSPENVPDLSGLTETERSKLLDVMKKAKEFEEKEELSLKHQPLSGLLCKYTNVMKGWQFRWFTLEPSTGMLEYFEKEEYKSQRPRGFLHLAGSVICPSDEDSMTFNINAANGEIYRLRAADAKERQYWVDRLRTIAQEQTSLLAPKVPQVFRSELRQRSTSHPNLGPSKPNLVAEQPSGTSNSQWYTIEGTDDPGTTTVRTRSQHKTIAHTVVDPLREVKEFVSEVEDHQHHLVDKIEELPPSGDYINGLDKEMLLLKATSQATLVCIEKCLNMLQQQHTASMQHASSLPSGATVEWLEPRAKPGAGELKLRSARLSGRSGSESSVNSFNAAIFDMQKAVVVNHDEDIEDTEDHTENELGGVEEHKSIILHLLSQLKLGMDLTKVVLPTFILEKRSLLEMFADCMAHPDIFLKIPEGGDPESRMLQVVEWYLTSFHAGRQGSVAKKPYNPIIGESFHCSWDMPPECTENNKKPGKLVYCAEQVSHHPPISAFYFECPDKQMCMNASIWTKSKFMGMSIGVVMIGKLSLHLLSHGEEYIFGLPSAYARSILSYPWVELGDKVTISCRKTGYSASIIFHTKPFYGGKLHRLTAEVRSAASPDILCKVTGEWNGKLEFTYSNGNTKTVDVNKLAITKKKVRPLGIQNEFESRKLWHHVTNALKLGDINTATEHKKFLESRQRENEKHRKENNIAFPTKYFHKDGDSWIFNKMPR